MNIRKIVIAVLATVSLVGGGALVFAHQVEDDDAPERAAVQNADVTLTEAIAIAEKEVPGGKVMEAEVEFENGAVSYFIEIEKDGVQRVRVDMETGQPSRVAAELDDDDDDDDDD